MSIETVLRFAELGLSAPVLQAVDDIGYETPSPIQARSIPPLLAGRDLLGQAQTGTGKTAAFSLPLLCRVDPGSRATQILVLTPTRELAIQVAEAVHSYAKHLGGVNVLPIYGGQPISAQLRPLARGVQVVVGTPGRVIDHLERGSLRLDEVTAVVLDEADEMLRMGFIEDVDRILSETPKQRQVALFSATMPEAVRRIAERHLKDPERITVEATTATVPSITQHALIVPWRQKLDALTRILETSDYDAMLVFVRTKITSVEVAEKLEARGHAVAALNGDMTQPLRERAVQRLRDGQLDIVVATDVAARGLDVPRISHVVNYDMPTDVESYVHRIGRTGRAGREGESLLLVQPREQRLLRAIEKATGQPITPLPLPTASDVTERRVGRFKQLVQETIEGEELSFFHDLVGQMEREQECEPAAIAAALAFLVQQDRPLRPQVGELEAFGGGDSGDRARDDRGGDRGPRRGQDRAAPPGGYASYRVEVGKGDGVQPKHLVGAIANEAGLEGPAIGRVRVFHRYSVVELPADLPASAIRRLSEITVLGIPLAATRVAGPDAAALGPGEPLAGRSPRPPAPRTPGSRPQAPRTPSAPRGDAIPTTDPRAGQPRKKIARVESTVRRARTEHPASPPRGGGAAGGPRSAAPRPAPARGGFRPGGPKPGGPRAGGPKPGGPRAGGPKPGGARSGGPRPGGPRPGPKRGGGPRRP